MQLILREEQDNNNVFISFIVLRTGERDDKLYKHYS
jgi:hypothetical protein